MREPDITARALEIIDEKLPSALVYAWLDTAQDVLVEVMREQNKEKAAELLLEFQYGLSARPFNDEEDDL